MLFKRFLIIFSLFLSLLLPLISVKAQTTTTNGVYDYNYVSSFDGSTQPAEHIQEGKDTSGLGSTVNYLVTLLIVAIVIFIIFRLLQGAFLKGTYDNIYSQAKGDKSIRVAGLALILTVLAYATLSFIYPGLTGWSVSTDYTANVSGGGVYGNTTGMCGIQVSGNGPCQDTDATNPFSNSSDPKGLKNNNPGNIRQSASNNWYGICLKQSDNAFVQFKNPESGIRAMAKLLINYQQDKKLDTIAKIINTWAPGSDNNNPNSYAAVVAKNMGIGVNNTLPDLSKDLSKTGPIFKFIQGITQVENGNKQAYSDDIIVQGLSTANQDLSGGATCTSAASPYLANNTSQNTQNQQSSTQKCAAVAAITKNDLISIGSRSSSACVKDTNLYLTKDAAIQFQKMVAAAKKANPPINLIVTQAYRSDAEQLCIRKQNNCSGSGSTCPNGNSVAVSCAEKGGGSNHSLGKAVDIIYTDGHGHSVSCNNGNNSGCKNSPEYTWLKANAITYTFKQSNYIAQHDPIHWSTDGN